MLKYREKGLVRSVLGVDAAWTLAQPSGVALATESQSGCRLLAVASSYQRFESLADTELEAEERSSSRAVSVRSENHKQSDTDSCR
jgi:hypothetical protein